MAIMDFTRLSLYLLILTLSFLSSPSQTLGTCSTCSSAVGPLPLPLPPVTVPPVIEKPPVTVPVINPPATKKSPCAPPKPKPKPTPKPTPKPCPPTPAAPTYCPIDTIKFGACLDILGAVVRVGDPAVECCSLIEGITSLEAAVCLCTIIKAKALGIHVFFPIALELLVTCGKTPPPGYKCF